MLRRLILERFGRFRETAFEFAPVTIFLGPNESGKTTVFDAIRMHTFAPARRGKENRLFYERYGDDTTVSAEWNDTPPQMDDGTFMNLFAVRGGDMAPDFSQDWVGALKQRLFAGGVDLQALREELGRRASTSGTLRHMRERKGLEEEYAAVSARLAEKEGQRNAILRSLEELEQRAAPVAELTARLAEQRLALAHTEAEARRQERIQQRATAEERLQVFRELETLDAWLGEHPAAAADESERLDALERQRDEARQRRQAAEAARNEARSTVYTARATLAEREARLAAMAPAAETLRELRLRLEAHRRGLLRPNLSWLGHVLPSAVLGVLGIVLLLGVQLAGEAAFGGSSLVAPGAIALGILLLAGAVAIPLVRTALQRRAHGRDEARLLLDIRERWRVVAGLPDGTTVGGAVLQADTLGGAEAALQAVSRELERLQLQRDEAATTLREAGGRADKLDAALEAAERVAAEATETVAAWLRQRGADSRDAYRQRLATHGAQSAQRQRLLSQATAWVQEGNFEDVAACRAVTESRLRELDAEGVPRETLRPEQREATRQEVARLRAEIEQLDREREQRQTELNNARQYQRGQLGTVPEDIAALAQRLHDLEQQLARNTLEREAAGEAAAIIDAISGEESALLGGLAGEVGELFHGMRGAADVEEAVVAMGALDGDSLQARDRGGEWRAVAHLSSGARQLLYLALRLAMALRTHGDAFALLSMDEPFAHLDPTRLAAALDLLRRFVGQAHWQLVLFTADPAQARLAQQTFAACKLHELG
jgi:DNA repair exonuclease SbcCD ATPase subunit